ncbi:glycosyltransferase [Streptomyces hoynatensis]|uniref:glycosyltransferase n=1 Tax=Streptomyces hoynatensis TaxID=1141874 RepID=UPI001F4E088D|nr:glycosyltransferase [Streptomyces hoynatensis]
MPHWYEGVSRLSDERMAAHLAETDADVVISTRPVLHTYLGRYGTGRYLRVGQEHSTLSTRTEASRDLRLAAVPLLDAFCPVAEADTLAYRAALPRVRTRIVHIVNSCPRPAVSPSTGDSRLIVAAGRLVEPKGYDRLLDAFAQVADEFPDWQLRIYGRGPARGALREQIDRLGLNDRARLMGAVSPIETEWAKGALAAVTSSWESFGLTLVEAMACGVPVLSTDCPVGPREIITHGHDGLLVPVDTTAVAEGLRTLLKDDELRARMAANAPATAARYEPDVVARAYEALFATLRPHGKGALTGRLRGLVRPRSAKEPAAPARAESEAGPVADCAATGDGGFHVAVRGQSGGELVLRLRKSPDRRAIRLPLGQDGQVTVHRAAQQLDEGRWDAFLATDHSLRPLRLAAGIVQQAALVNRPPTVDALGVHAWIPYPTKDGNLSIRAWHRPAHAEVTALTSGPQTTLVTAAVLAPETIETVRATCRTEDDQEFPLALEALERGRVRLTLPHAEAAARHVAPGLTWRVLLHTADGRTLPVGRIGGDIPDRKGIDVHPAGTHGTLLVRPRYTAANDLVLTTKPAAQND